MEMQTVDDILCIFNKLLSVGQIRVFNVRELGSIFVNLEEADITKPIRRYIEVSVPCQQLPLNPLNLCPPFLDLLLRLGKSVKYNNHLKINLQRTFSHVLKIDVV
jgi:hypothetical protein